MTYYVNDQDKKVFLTIAETESVVSHAYDRPEMLVFLETIRRGITLTWTMISLIFLFNMQVGLAFMATGAARRKSKSAILTHQILTICISTIIYTILSHDLSSVAKGGILGTVDTSLKEILPEQIDHFTLQSVKFKLFNFMKILTCSQIACTQLQERTLIETYVILSFVISGVIAPVGFAWVDGDGWLSRLGFKDSTTAVVVYMCGGFCGLVGNLMLGPRLSVFEKTKIKANLQI